MSAVQTYMTADGLDQPAILYASQGGFSRPPIIVRLGSRRGYENGKPASPDARKDVLVDALFNSTARVQMTHLCRCFLWDLAA